MKKIFNLSIKSLFTLFILSLMTACATKHYGRQGKLTSYEEASMNCREIVLELSKIDGFLQHVDAESQFSGRSVFSFLGDFGIGNTLEKNAAIKSANERKQALKSLMLTKNCKVSVENN